MFSLLLIGFSCCADDELVFDQEMMNSISGSLPGVEAGDQQDSALMMQNIMKMAQGYLEAFGGADALSQQLQSMLQSLSGSGESSPDQETMQKLVENFNMNDLQGLISKLSTSFPGMDFQKLLSSMDPATMQSLVGGLSQSGGNPTEVMKSMDPEMIKKLLPALKAAGATLPESGELPSDVIQKVISESADKSVPQDGDWLPGELDD
ncbi:MAG: hypothetical protein PHQ23_08345 [Candidatus Wallbacteria bacterium]|nr:hypothetical protein [Candidatus Wallbacteria bacterium]